MYIRKGFSPNLLASAAEGGFTVLYISFLKPITGPNRGEYMSEAAWGRPRSISSDSAKKLSTLEGVYRCRVSLCLPIHGRQDIGLLIGVCKGRRTHVENLILDG